MFILAFIPVIVIAITFAVQYRSMRDPVQFSYKYQAQTSFPSKDHLYTFDIRKESVVFLPIEEGIHPTICLIYGITRKQINGGYAGPEVSSIRSRQRHYAGNGRTPHRYLLIRANRCLHS